jgi:hypothetical protein
MAEVDRTKPVAAVLTEEQRKLAMQRFDVLRPHVRAGAKIDQ